MVENIKNAVEEKHSLFELIQHISCVKMWCGRAVILTLIIAFFYSRTDVVLVQAATVLSGCEYQPQTDETKCHNMEFTQNTRIGIPRFGKKLDFSLIRSPLYGADTLGGPRPDVRELIIRSSNISALSVHFLATFPQLESLLIKINHGFPNLTAADVFPAQCCTHLKTLRISDNNFAHVDSAIFRNMPALETLSIEKQYLGPLGAGYFDGLGQLRRLRLQHCQIGRIEVGAFRALGQLQRLELPTNEVDRIVPGTFEALNKLEELHLSGNVIRNFVGGEFNGLGNLRRLELVGNRVHSLNIDKILENVPKLERISIKLTYVECAKARHLVEKIQESNIEIKNFEDVLSDNCHLDSAGRGGGGGGGGGDSDEMDFDKDDIN